MKLYFKPSDTFSGDLRLRTTELDLRGFYFVIPRDDEANLFSTFTTRLTPTTSRARSRSTTKAIDDRDLLTGALRLNFDDRAAAR